MCGCPPVRPRASRRYPRSWTRSDCRGPACPRCRGRPLRPWGTGRCSPCTRRSRAERIRLGHCSIRRTPPEARLECWLGRRHGQSSAAAVRLVLHSPTLARRFHGLRVLAPGRGSIRRVSAMLTFAPTTADETLAVRRSPAALRQCPRTRRTCHRRSPRGRCGLHLEGQRSGVPKGRARAAHARADRGARTGSHRRRCAESGGRGMSDEVEITHGGSSRWT